MNIEHLVRMANDIADFFAAEPSEEEAVRGVLNHFTRYWEARMRAQIVEHYHAGGEGLSEIARAAVARLEGR
jgi:formate dehydrogenase subunit delta